MRGSTGAAPAARALNARKLYGPRDAWLPWELWEGLC